MTFLFLFIVCMAVFYGIAHIDSYFGARKRIKEEYLDDFTFISYTKDELKRWFTGKGPN